MKLVRPAWKSKGRPKEMELSWVNEDMFGREENEEITADGM